MFRSQPTPHKEDQVDYTYTTYDLDEQAEIESIREELAEAGLL